MKNITFPNTPLPLDASIDISTPKPLGLTAKVLIQECARKLPIYNQSIECEVMGYDNKGNDISVNTVGRWLFGVPGFSGHIRITAGETAIVIHYPKSAPEEVHELLSSLKAAMIRELLKNN